MSTEARRTLVVDLDLLEQHRDGLRRRLAEEFPGFPSLLARVDAIEGVIRMGTTVPLDHLTVVELATPVERPQFYSEADYADADLLPAGGTA